MRRLIITILVHTIGCLTFGMYFEFDIMFPKTTTIISDIILFVLTSLLIIYCYATSIEELKTQTKIEYFDEIRRHLKK